MINYESDLDSINRAIAAIEQGAQEYRIGTRTVRRADLSTLYGERIRLQQCVESRNGCDICYPRLARRG